jgi:hypothetical protein
MFFLPNLSQRQRQPEIMDQPDLSRPEHFQALRGLQRINRFSGSARILWPPICALARELAPRPLRLLDLATGAGDVPLRLWRKAREVGVNLQVEGCDLSSQALDYARQRAQSRGADVQFFRLNVLTEDLPAGYDILTSSLFLHHLDDEEASKFLRRMAEAAGQLVLVNDLVRCSGGLALAHLACRLLTRSRVVHWDGPRSVEAAFTITEARDLAQRAGLHGATIHRRWPCRYLLSWRRP